MVSRIALFKSNPPQCDDKGTQWRHQNIPTPVITCLYQIAVLCLWFNFRSWGACSKYQFTLEEASFKHINWPTRNNGCRLLIITSSDYAALREVQIISWIIKGSHNLSIISLPPVLRNGSNDYCVYINTMAAGTCSSSQMFILMRADG